MRSGIVIVLLVLLTVANGYVYLHRNAFEFTNQQSYNQLYPAINRIAVDKVEKTHDGRSLQLHIRNAAAAPVTWLLQTDTTVYSFEAVHPHITLTPGLHQYMLSAPAYKDSISAGIEFLPAGSGRESSIVVFYHTYISNTLPEEVDGYHIGNEISPEEMDRVRLMLKDSMKGADNGTTVEKVNRIAAFLHPRIFRSAGTPEDSVVALNTFQQYIAATAGKKIWCGIYAGIFNMFAEAAGIKSRTIEMKYGYPGLDVNTHVFNEFFDMEHLQWAAVDIMYNNTRYFNAAGRVLNGMDVKNTDMHDSSVKVMQVAGDSFTHTAFAALPKEFHDLYGRNKDAYFYIRPANRHTGVFAKINKYLSSSSSYVYYSDSRITDNKNFYIRQLLFLLWLTAVICTAAIFLIRYLNHKQ